MKCRRVRNGNRLLIHFSGNIIFEDTSGFADHLYEALTEEFDEAILDFSDVSGITSSAIGKVIDFHANLLKTGRRMEIRGMSEKAHSVFKYFKLDELFPIRRESD